MKVICKKCGARMNFPQTEDITFTWKCEKCMSNQVHEAVKIPKKRYFKTINNSEENDGGTEED